MNPYAACSECGNDEPTEGHSVCLDCLEAATPVPGNPRWPGPSYKSGCVATIHRDYDCSVAIIASKPIPTTKWCRPCLDLYGKTTPSAPAATTATSRSTTSAADTLTTSTQPGGEQTPSPESKIERRKRLRKLARERRKLAKAATP